MIKMFIPLIPIIAVAYVSKLSASGSGAFMFFAPIVFSLLYVLSLFCKQEGRYIDLDIHGLTKELAQMFEIDCPKVSISDSPSINAFVNGVLKFAEITLSMGAKNKLTDKELVGVLAHELAHIKNHHPAINAVFMVGIGIIYTVLLVLNATYLSLSLASSAIIILFAIKSVYIEIVADSESSKVVSKDGIVAFLKRVGGNSIYSKIRLWSLNNV